MADIVSPEVRSRMMAGIRSSGTKAEVELRSALHRRGLRFRKNLRTLPGTPDIVVPRAHCCIFVHGCFWHGHTCAYFRWPGTRADFWRAKIEKNQANDRVALESLSSAGWRVGVVWECATRSGQYTFAELADRLADWIASDEGGLEIPA